MKTFLKKKQVIQSLNSHLLTLLPIQDAHETYQLPASSLVCAARFDVLSKYIYAKLWRRNVAAEWRSKVYFESQNIFGFKEGDASGKDSHADYINGFEDLLNSVKRNGFTGFLPVGAGDVIIDGVHRLGAALAFNREVPVIKFDVEPARYDYKFFLERGLDAEVADAMALEFCRLSPNMVIAVVFPIAKGKSREVQSILKEYGQVAYEKQVVFSEIGRHNLIRQLYRNEAWLGKDGEITSGLRHHVEKRFVNNLPVTFYFLVSRDVATLKEAKSRIRALFDLQNDSIHINDTYEETLRIAEQVLTPNSLHFFNHAQPWLSPKFSGMFKEYQQEVKHQGLDKDSLCIDSGSVLAVYGLRDTNDLDYMHFDGMLSRGFNSNISDHNAELTHHIAPLGDLLFDPRNYFYYDSMKFLSLQALRGMKERRNEAKDIKDVLLIDSVRGNVQNSARIWRGLRFSSRKAYENITHFELWKIKNILPQSWHPFARKIYHAPFYLSQSFGTMDRKIKYKGFNVHYSRGTSLISWIHTGNTYEPELTWKILETLKKKERPVMLDIGANIGLISLNVLAALPHVHIFAFEPGPHQFSYFKKTILDNGLRDRISLENAALSFESGKADFSVHESAHASGDGFFDTGRAGRAKKIEVQVKTLDEWWHAAGQPAVDVVKMDTEGAEYWVLQGARSFLGACKPIIFLEISEENLQMYPYDAMMIMDFFTENGYALKTLADMPVMAGQLSETLKSTQDFMAAPRK